MFQILIAEDDKNTRKLMEAVLKCNGFNPIPASSGEEALKLLDRHHIDLAVLDIMMPGMDGYELTRHLRSMDYNLPILMVTAKVLPEDKRKGFMAGTDDYMTKPFSPSELVARVKAQLRRYKKYNVGSAVMAADEVFKYAGLTMNIKTYECRLNGETLSLTPTEFSILRILLERKCSVVSAEELFHEVWQEEYYTKSNNTITVHIRHLREKMKDTGENPRYIKTVWGVGYKIGEI